jgi:hypothetical protein
LAGGNAEFVEAVEQVVATPGAEICANFNLAAAQADFGAERAIGDDLRMDRSGHEQGREQPWTKAAEAEGVGHRLPHRLERGDRAV